MRDTAVLWALLASLVIHAGFWMVPTGLQKKFSARAHAAAERTDLWAGDTFEAPEVLGPGAPDPGQGRAAGETPIDIEPAAAPARPRPAPRPAAAAGAGTTTGGPSAGSGTGTYGAEGASDGARDLVRSFVRALPPAASPDPVWALLPLGPAGSADVTFAVDDDGKVRLVDRPPSAPPIPVHIASIVRRTLVLLASGRFALDPRHASAGTETLRLSVTVSQTEPPSDRELQSGGAFGLGSEAPADARAGRAYFTLASGRHVDVTVQRIRPAR